MWINISQWEFCRDMLKCATCGAELQNPFNNYGETSVEWLHIHTNKPHSLEKLPSEALENQLLMDIQHIYKKYHNEHGVRLIK